MIKKERKPRRKITVPKTCFFCDEKKNPTYAEAENLRKFLTERGKIIPRSRNGLCSQHQRKLTLGIKHARHLALLPFVGQR